MHNRSYFLSKLSRIENGELMLSTFGDQDRFVNPLETISIYVEGK
jgi:hypothetical protein